MSMKVLLSYMAIRGLHKNIFTQGLRYLPIWEYISMLICIIPPLRNIVHQRHNYHNCCPLVTTITASTCVQPITSQRLFHRVACHYGQISREVRQATDLAANKVQLRCKELVMNNSPLYSPYLSLSMTVPTSQDHLEHQKEM